MIKGLFRNIILRMGSAVAIACCTSVAAQAAAPEQSAAAKAAPAAAKPVDPARLAAARPVVEKLWPLGTYRRMMDGVMNGMMQRVMNQMFDMPASDFAKAAGLPDGKEDATKGKTLGELATEADPYFRERTTIATDVMLKEMLPLIEKLEPGIRDALATVYARQFSEQQLADMNQFFATPSGQAFASEFMMTFVNPELMGQMQSFVPEILQAMPAITAKIEAATAHLPKPNKAADTDMSDEPAPEE